MDEGALGGFHLGTGVVESLAAPHDGTLGFLQRAVQLGLIQPGGETGEARMNAKK